MITAIVFTFIGLAVMLIATNLLERHHNRTQIQSLMKIVIEQKSITEGLIEDVNNSVKSSARLLGMMNKMNTGVKKNLSRVVKDMDQIIKVVSSLAENQQSYMQIHNDLVNYTIDEIAKIWCDLCEDDCYCCPFEPSCKAREKLGMVFNQEKIDPPQTVDDYNKRSITGSMTIDPKDPSQVEALLNELRIEGIPEKVIKKFSKQIQEAIKTNPEELSISWSTPVNEVVKNNSSRNENKLIDPNSKIVKSLEKIYRDSN